MGKPVLSAEQFSYDTVQIGDYVAQEVVDEAMNCLPPACMTSECAQLGEPYSHREDPDTGRWRAVYATFRRVSESVWEYRGHCFRGETTERGRELNGSIWGDADFRSKKSDKSDKTDKGDETD